MIPSTETLTIDEFVNSIQEFSFQQKYFKWQSYVKVLKKQQSQYYQAGLQKLVQYYPFNFTYWSQIIELLLKMPKGKVNTLKMYQVALAKNPKCLTLWKKYLDWLMKELSRSDPKYLRNQLQAATKSIGSYYKASFVFQYYFQVEKDIEKKYFVMKNAMVSPLQQIQKIYQMFLDFIDSSEFSPYTLSISEMEGLYIQQTNDRDSQDRILKQQIKSRISKLYQPTKQYIQQCSIFQEKITVDEYSPYSDSIQNWRKYISFIKNSGNLQFLPSIYERALITQCDNESLWQQYFMILENEGDHQRVLYLLRSHSLFFRSVSKQLTYYWLQIQQRQNPAHSRELYLQLQKSQNDLQIFMRHIQLQLRSKEINNVKSLYLTILTSFTANLNIISYAIIQYVQFYVKYFRDIGNAKSILKDYFQSYPYSEYLLVNYLDFFTKHIQIKDGTRESKEVADEFVDAVLNGLRKAYFVLSPADYKKIKKRVSNQLRNYILSAEKKIREQEISLEKNGKRQKKLQEKQKQNEIEILKKIKTD